MKKVVMELPEKSRPAHDLDGKTWTRYSISVWDDIQKTAEERHLKHPALFPQHLVRRLIRLFSNKGDLVLDPFMGSGSTLLEAGNLGRRGLGLDITQEYIDLFNARTGNKRCEERPVLIAHCDDARNLPVYASPLSVDLCLTSPPYWNILQEKRTADKKKTRNYGNLQCDLGNIESYNDFLDGLEDIFCKVYHSLKQGKYCLVVVMDIRKKNHFFPLHMDLTQRMQLIGFTLDDMIIWDRRKEYNHLRPLGFPYVFRINKVHEYILIFQKR